MRKSKLYQNGLTPENFLTVRKEGMIPEVSRNFIFFKYVGVTGGSSKIH